MAPFLKKGKGKGLGFEGMQLSCVLGKGAIDTHHVFEEVKMGHNKSEKYEPFTAKHKNFGLRPKSGVVKL